MRMDDSTIKTLLNNDVNASAQKIGFLLLNQFSLLAFASAIEPLRAANRQSGKQLFDWMVASPNSISSVASNGIEVQTNIDPDHLKNCCMVFVCAGLDVRKNTNKAILNLVRRLDRNGAKIGAICKAIAKCLRHPFPGSRLKYTHNVCFATSVFAGWR